MKNRNCSILTAVAVLCSAFYAPVSQAAELVAHYKFEDPDNLGLDSSGWDNHADVVEEVEQVEGALDGKFGQGAFFDEGAASSFIKNGGLAGFTGKPGVTLAAWVKLDESTTGFDGIISQDAGACCDNRILLHNGDHKPFINLSEHQDVHIVDAEPVEFEVWTHIAMTGMDVDGDAEAYVYVNGVAVEGGPWIFPEMDDGSEWNTYLGVGEAGNAHRLTGALDDVRIYEGALTEEEVLGLLTPSEEKAYAQDFDAFADGTTDLGDGTVMSGTAMIVDGRLQLTENDVAGGFASFSIPPIPGSSEGWAATFDLTISDGEGANEPADGMSFNYGNAELGELGSAEEGMAGIATVTENISFEIDTWMNLDAEQGVNIAEKVDEVDTDLEFTNGPILEDGTEVSGRVKITYDPVAGLSFSTTGLLTNADFAGTATDFEGNDDYTFVISARVGGANETLTIDNLVISTGPPLIAHFTLDSDGNSADGAFVPSTTADVEFGAAGANPNTGTSASFNGASSVIQHDWSEELNPDGNFTLTLWAKSNGGAGAWNSPVTSRHDLFNEGETSQGYLIYDNNPMGVWTFWSGNGEDPGNWQTLDGPEVTLGEWEHVAITYDDEEQVKALYINGELAAEGDSSITPNDTTPFNIGAGQDNGDGFWFDGELDDIALWGALLTEEEIMQVKDLGVAGFRGLGVTVDLLNIVSIKADTSGLSFNVRNQGTSVVDKDSIVVTIDGEVVETTVADIEGGVSVTYVADPAWLPGSVHPYNIVVKDMDGNDANRAGEGEGKVKDSLMPFNTPLVGPDGEEGVWGVRYVWDVGTLGTTTAALAALQRSDDPDFDGQVFDTTSAFANLNNARPELFPDSDLYPDEVLDGGGGAEDFLVSYKGILRIDSPGLYTFGYNTDDGAGLRIFGAEFISKGGAAVIDPVQPSSLVFVQPTGNSDSHAVANLAAGTYPIEFFWYERGGGDKGVLYFAKGEYADDSEADAGSAEDGMWELVGGERLVGAGALPFQITDITKTGADVTITFQSTEGAGYTIERATPEQLSTGDFEELQDGFEGQAGDTTSFTDPGVDGDEVYYRVRAE